MYCRYSGCMAQISEVFLLSAAVVVVGVLLSVT